MSMHGRACLVRFLLLAVLFLSGCRTDQPSSPVHSIADPAALLLPAPEGDFRLSAEERSRIHPADEPALVEQLLAWIRPERRSEVLESFTFWYDLGPAQKTALGPIQWLVPHAEVEEIIRQINERRLRGAIAPDTAAT